MATKNIVISTAAVLGLLLVGGALGYWFLGGGAESFQERAVAEAQKQATEAVAIQNRLSQDKLNRAVEANLPAPEYNNAPPAENLPVPIADAPPLPLGDNIVPETPAEVVAETPAAPAVDVPEPADEVVAEQAKPAISIGEPVAGSQGVVAGTAVPLSSAITKANSARISQGGLVGQRFIGDLAKLMVGNYWPMGTHIKATSSGYVGLTPRVLNTHYGANFAGFDVDSANQQRARQDILQYAFVPSMLKELYARYSAPLVRKIDEEFTLLAKASNNLQDFERAEMFNLYANFFQATSGVLSAYLQVPNINVLFHDALFAEVAARKAGENFFEAQARQVEELEVQRLANRYQESVIKREQARDSIVSAIRRNGNTKGMDDDSIMFIVSWLQRRGNEARPSIATLQGLSSDFAMLLSKQAAQIK